MSLTFNKVQGNGSSLSYPIIAESGYFNQNDIVVELIHISTGLSYLQALGSDYTIEDNIVIFNVAPPSDYYVSIRREVDQETTYSDFNIGNPFGATNLNNSFLKNLYQIQQLADGFLPDDFYLKAHLNAGAKRITNMSEPISDNDATTKKWVTNVLTQIYNVPAAILNENYLSAYGSFEEALYAIGSVPTRLVVDIETEEDVIFPANISLDWRPTALARGSLTFSCDQIVAGNYQLFGSEATIIGLLDAHIDWFDSEDKWGQAASISSLRKLRLGSGVYRCTSPLIFTNLQIIGNGYNNTTIESELNLDESLFTFTTFGLISGILFKPIGESPKIVYGASITNGIVIRDNRFELDSFTGVYAGSSGPLRCLDLQDTGDVFIENNYFVDGWNDKNYHAGNVGGSNVLRTISIGNHSQNNVNINNNTFTNPWTAVYVDNTNYVRIMCNLITDTADTAIFERCTAGRTYTKLIAYNTLKNIGKAGIKTLDTNNDTPSAGGDYSFVIGNYIENWGLNVLTSAIFSATNYTSTGYKYSDTQRNSNLIISNNIIIETNVNSDHRAIRTVNTDNLLISNNRITLLGDNEEWSIGPYCRLKFINNIVKVDSNVVFKNNLRSIVSGNSFESNITIYVSDYVSTSPETNKLIFIFKNNYSKTNSVVTGEGRESYGVQARDNNDIGCFIITNNTFETAIPFVDNNSTKGTHICRIPTNAIETSLVDNNTVIFTDKVSLQKVFCGNILYPAYYHGMRGSAIIDDETTGVIRYKANNERENSYTITPDV